MIFFHSGTGPIQLIASWQTVAVLPDAELEVVDGARHSVCREPDNCADVPVGAFYSERLGGAARLRS